MAGRIGSSGAHGQVSASEVEGAAAISAGAGDGAAGVADGSGAPNAIRTARAKSLDMGGFDLASRLSAQLDATPSTSAATGAAARPAAGKSITPDFDAALATMKAGGLDGKEAKALMKIAAQTIKTADDPAAAFHELSRKTELLYEGKITPEAEAALGEAEDANYVVVLEAQLGRAKDAGKKIGDHLKTNAATLKPPLSEIDPKSVKGAVNEETGYVAFKLKSGAEGAVGDKHALALAALIQGDAKLTAVKLGTPLVR